MKRTILWIKSASARSIGKFTLNVMLMDYVLLPGTKLKIQSIIINPNDENEYVAHLEELVMFRERKSLLNN